MKFRIVEEKQSFWWTIFIPQYKDFIFWNDISDTKFARTFYCTVEFKKNNYVWSMKEADKVISDYENYLLKGESYTLIHNRD